MQSTIRVQIPAQYILFVSHKCLWDCRESNSFLYLWTTRMDSLNFGCNQSKTISLSADNNCVVSGRKHLQYFSQRIGDILCNLPENSGIKRKKLRQAMLVCLLKGHGIKRKLADFSSSPVLLTVQSRIYEIKKEVLFYTVYVVMYIYVY